MFEEYVLLTTGGTQGRQPGISYPANASLPALRLGKWSLRRPSLPPQTCMIYPFSKCLTIIIIHLDGYLLDNVRNKIRQIEVCVGTLDMLWVLARLICCPNVCHLSSAILIFLGPPGIRKAVVTRS